MRALGNDLGVTPMAIYRHVDSRDALVEAVIDRALDDVVGADPALSLFEQLSLLDEQLGVAFGQLPDLALMLIRNGPSTERSVALIDAVVRGFVAAGLEPEEAARTYATVSTLALARVAMPRSVAGHREAYRGRPSATAASAWLTRSETPTVDLVRQVGRSLDHLAGEDDTDRR